MNTRIFLILILAGFAGTAFSKDLNQKFDSITNEINKISFYENQKAEELLVQLYQIIEQNPENKSLRAQYYYWTSYHNYSQGKINLSIKDSIGNYLKKYNSNTIDKAILFHSMALNEVVEGNYTEALTKALTALKVYQNSGEILYKSRALQLIGVICYRTRNFELSEKYSKESLSLSVPKTEYYKSLLNQYSAQVFIESKSDEVLKSMIAQIPTLQKFDNPGFLAVLYLNIGCRYFLYNEMEDASLYFDKVLEILPKIDNKSFNVSVYLNTSSYFLTNGNYDLAKKYIEAANSAAVSLNDQEQLALIYLLTSNLYDKTRKTDSAFVYLKKYNGLKENLLSKSGAADSYEAYVSSFLESAEQEVAIAHQLSMLDKRRLTITLISCLFIVLLSVAVFIILNQRKKQQILKEETEKERLQNQLNHEREIQQIEAEKHKLMLDAKTREITSYSLILSNKNDVLQDVLNQTKQLKTNDKTAYKNILQAVNNNLNADNETAKFMVHFNEVHPDFFNKLKSICPELTENNMRMCAYFKMGISPKQVSSIMNISVETVKNSRYRLKKKLKLSESESLDSFIRNI